jgi:hypothetical protein
MEEALAAQPAPACPDHGRMVEFTPPPAPNRREWACPVCGLIAQAVATIEEGYLLWNVQPRGGSVGTVLISLLDW